MNNKTRRGKFITVEGIEGTGKSTNIDYLTSLLTNKGIEVVTTREPGGTPMAEAIRRLLLDHGQEPVPPIAELLLFFASRSLHLHNLIVPALESGQWVVCDRFTDATRAYQGDGRGQSAQRIESLADWVHDGVEPDLTLLIDMDPATGLARALGRNGGEERFESFGHAMQESMRAGFLDLARSFPARIRVIDGARAQDVVAAEVADVVTAHLAGTSAA